MIKKLILSAAAAIFIVLSSGSAFAASDAVTAIVPEFPVTLNELNVYELSFNNEPDDEYPFLLYNDIVYFPMTYCKANLLNLNIAWSEGTGLVIEQGDPCVLKEVSYSRKRLKYAKSWEDRYNYEKYASPPDSGCSYTAAIADMEVTVNGERIDNEGEEYPLLFFRDITYFPLTWRFAVDEFGWGYTFSGEEGLSIRADNFFYTSKGDSYVKDGEFVTAFNETYYIQGDLSIYISTETQRLLGPISRNLHIIRNGEDVRPAGYFGYYQKKALFSR